MPDPTSQPTESFAAARQSAVRRKQRIAVWALYDWANSGYSTLSITVLVAYLQNVVFPTAAWGRTGAVVWAWGIAFSMLVGALLSPLLGAVADARASKRVWLGATAFCGAFACVVLAFVPVANVWLIVSLFVAANLCFELSLVFYNGFLPEIVDESEFNRVSAWGYGVGYVGGGIALALVIGVFLLGPSYGLSDRAGQLRLGLVVMGLWWAVFAIPAFLTLKDHAVPERRLSSAQEVVRNAWRDIVEVLRNVRAFKALALFLFAFLCYNDGIQTVLSQASTFALQELSFREEELLLLILVIQFAALPGSLLVGWLADRHGQKEVLLGCLAIWITLLWGAYFVTTKLQFWLLGGAVAMVMGGTQSVSRAIMGVMTPKNQAAKFFGFYNLSGKATGFFGPFLFGLIFAATGSARWAIVSLFLFFALGTALVARVDVQHGRQVKEAMQ